MSDSDRQGQNWWTTLPGILTGMATLITAIGGLIVILNSNSCHKSNSVTNNINTLPVRENSSSSDNNNLSSQKQTSKDSIASNQSMPQIGKFYEGGIVFYIDESGKHGLIAAPSDQGEAKWENGTNIEIGSFSKAIFSGQENTKAIISKLGSGRYAAKLCDDLILNGYNDWYLPSELELRKLWDNKDLVGGFNGEIYWTSTEQNDPQYITTYHFPDFAGGASLKTEVHSVRAIRAF